MSDSDGTESGSIQRSYIEGTESTQCAFCSSPFVTFTLTDICLDTYKITILTIMQK